MGLQGVVSAANLPTKIATPAPVLNTPLSSPVMGQVLIGLVFVLVLILGLAWFLKRFGTFQTALGGQMKILGGLSLGARDRVVLMQVGETQLLLGISPGRIQRLHVFAEGESLSVPTESAATTSPFATRLHDLLDKKGDQHA